MLQPHAKTLTYTCMYVRYINVYTGVYVLYACNATIIRFYGVAHAKDIRIICLWSAKIGQTSRHLNRGAGLHTHTHSHLRTEKNRLKLEIASHELEFDGGACSPFFFAKNICMRKPLQKSIISRSQMISDYEEVNASLEFWVNMAGVSSCLSMV